MNAPRIGKGNKSMYYTLYASAAGLQVPKIVELKNGKGRLQKKNVPGSKEEVEKFENDAEIPKYPEKRRPEKRALSEAPQIVIDEWFERTGVKLGKLTDEQKNKVTRLLYTYEDLNSTDLENLPYTDLNLHKWVGCVFGKGAVQSIKGPLSGMESRSACLREYEEDQEILLSENLSERDVVRDRLVNRKYIESGWYAGIAEYLASRRFLETYQTKVQRAALVRKVSRFSVERNGSLWKTVGRIKKRCIVEAEVASLLMEAHDNSGHFDNQIFEKFGTPVGIYMDPGPHFGKKTRRFAEEKGIIWCNSPVAAKKAVGMIEKAVDILQRILKKITLEPKRWPNFVAKATLEMNSREIAHLSHSPAQIFLGFIPTSSLGVAFPGDRRTGLVAALKADLSRAFLEDDEHLDLVIKYVQERSNIQDKVLERSNIVKERTAEKYNLGIRRPENFNPGDLVMLFDHRQSGKKLLPTWRGPFVINGFGGDMGKSYEIRQISGSKIPRHYHGDSLKRFRMREGYLATGMEEKLPVYQNIRLGRAIFRLPKDIRST
ncbi:hypothetical protein EPUL_005422, partial [Erysiphe pulchra]